MSALLLTNLFATQAGSPAANAVAVGYGMAGALTSQAVTPTTSSANTAGSGSSTSYDGTGAGAGGAASRQPLKSALSQTRPPDATPRSIVTALAQNDAQSITADEPAERPEIVDMAEQTRKQAQEMPLPLPTLSFLLPDTPQRATPEELGLTQTGPAHIGLPKTGAAQTAPEASGLNGSGSGNRGQTDAPTPPQ